MREIRAKCGLVLSVFFLAAIGCSGQEGGLVLQLKRRNGGRFARSLLKNATIPLHGAVKDYGYGTIPTMCLGLYVFGICEISWFACGFSS